MGVPLFYRWLVNKYPKIICNAIESSGSIIPNLNGIEFDNFYLDVNGIIHHCFHPEDDNVFLPTTFEDVFRSVYECIDRLINIVAPRKLLFLAIDGVAPRAKMHQLRARRFRNANDIQITEEVEEKLRNQFEMEGKAVFPKLRSEVSDPNVITPGTEFMHVLSQKLQCYVSLRMKEHPSWADIKFVILSDDKVPGEGEHKIMSFIRAQRSSPGYDPNTRHCLYGLDADLIMLALTTHEIHISILRERQEAYYAMNLFSHLTTTGLNKEEARWSVRKRTPYEFVHIWVLREYLALDLEIPSAENSECDLERIIDDFIFICFFAGNDFLPRLPSLEVRESCLDLLMHVYTKEFRNFGGYLVDMKKAGGKEGGYLKLKKVEKFVLIVGSYEEKIFSKRRAQGDINLTRFLEKECEKKHRQDRRRASDIAVSCPYSDVDEVVNNTKELKQKLKDYVDNQSDSFRDRGLVTEQINLFDAPGWRERYYEAKFHAQNTRDIKAIRRDVVAKYGEGLHWVLMHYFLGVPSWTWFYPYDYAPLASDFEGLSRTKVDFQKGMPFKPFDQLMGVLPPRSAHALPLAYKGLMTDQNSKIIDFYPTEFETDIDGKRFLWQGIIKLPYIVDERLLAETKKLENELTDCEKLRNLESLDRLFFRCSSEESRRLLDEGIETASKKIKDAITMESPIEGLKGTIHLMPEDLYNHDWEDGKIDICVFYEINQGLKDVHCLLENVNIPEKVVRIEDIMETILWHEANTGNEFQKREPVKSVRKFQFTSQNPYPVFVYKGAGCGFRGRGKSSPIVGELELASETSSSSGWAHVSSDNYRGSKSGLRRRDNYGGFQGVRISDSNPCPMPKNRAWPTKVNDNYWTSDGGASEDWRLKVPRDEVLGTGPVQGSNTGYGHGRGRFAAQN